jgi:hypothetical protein
MDMCQPQRVANRASIFLLRLVRGSHGYDNHTILPLEEDGRSTAGDMGLLVSWQDEFQVCCPKARITTLRHH